MTRFTLSKQERLSSLKDIESLFREGQSVAKFPVRLVWRESSLESIQPFPVQVMFSVSKKKFARAVDRNRLKRLLRESYRLAKPQLYTLLPPGLSFQLAIIYSGTEILDFASIQKSMASALDRWVKTLSALSKES